MGLTRRTDGWPFKTSYWINAEPEREPTLRGPHRCDVLVVGGGFAGLSTAYHTKQAAPGTAVVLIEAEHCGAGASGKNQGIPAVHPPDAHGRLLSVLGDDGLRRFTVRQLGLLDEYEAFIEEHRIECEFHRSKAAWIVTTPPQLDYAHKLIAGYDAGGLPYREMSIEEARSTIGVRAIGGIEFGTETRADFNPYRFVEGLRRLALEVGVSIYEGTPALEVSPGPPAKVGTPDGAVEADQVVLAMNAYSSVFELSDGLHSLQWAYQVVTEPIDEAVWERIGWSGEHRLVNEIDPGLEWQAYRVMRDGRLFWSVGGGMFSQPDGVVLQNDNAPAIEYVWGELLRRFPFLADVRIESAHGAALDMSAVFYPVVGRLKAAPNVLVAVGFSGFGILPSWNSGRVLAGHLLGPSYIVGDDEEFRVAFREINPVARGRIL